MTLRLSIATGLLAGLLAAGTAQAQTETPAGAPVPDLSATCTPACAPGYLCHAGACVATAPAAEAAPEVTAPPAPAVNAPPAPAEPPAGNSTPPPVSTLPATPSPVATVPENKPGDENMIPAWIHTSDFVDTRLSFLFADENLLASPGETTPNSPGARIASAGQTAQFNQFYDNFNSRYTGFETLSNLVLYKKSDSFFHGLSAEAALALTVLVLSEKNNPQTQSTAIRDASSYIRLNYVPDGWDKNTEGISFTGFPLSGDRMRLGYAYKISWGGSDVFPNQGGSVPGAKLQINRKNWYAFGGVKTTVIYNEQLHEQESNYGFLGGAGIDVIPSLRLEANGGYFMKGVNPEPQVLGVPVNGRGISAEAVYHQGEPVGYSADFALYKNDPNQYINFFKPEKYPGGVSYTVSLEGSFLQQTLADPDVFGQTKTQNAVASALQGRIKIDRLRLNVLGLYRTLSFIQYNVPGFPPFFEFPASTTQSPEMFFAVGGDYYIPSLHLTPGLMGGIQRPASLTSSNIANANNPPVGLTGTRTVVVTDVNTFSVLPTGEEATPVISFKGTVRMDISNYVAAVGQAYFTIDNNRTTFRDDILGVAEPSFQKPYILGFNLLLQARF